MSAQMRLIVYWCRYMFHCVDVEDTLSVRKIQFLQKYCLLDNTVCALCRQQADIELASLNGCNFSQLYYYYYYVVTCYQYLVNKALCVCIIAAVIAIC